MNEIKEYTEKLFEDIKHKRTFCQRWQNDKSWERW